MLLIDDDNVIADNCILELVSAMENDLGSQIGIIAPITYYLKQPNRIWTTGVKINMLTSLTTHIGKNQIDHGQFNELIDSQGPPNAFMIRKELTKKIGLLDEKLFPIHYDEGDFGERVRQAGFKIVFNPKAKIWHDMHLPEEIEDETRLFHIHNELRAYYAGRNRILFHRKHSKWWQFLIFLFVFNCLFTLFYLKVIFFGSKKSFIERLRIAASYLNGVVDGIIG